MSAVAIIMGSQSDWDTMRHAAATLSALGIPSEQRIVSAHRTPDRLFAFAKGAKAASLEQAVDGLSFTFRGRNISAGASAGVAILGVHAEAGKALEEADSAMYVRKAQRRHEG